MKSYSKVVAALVGAVLMALNTWLDMSALMGMETEIANLIVACLTAAGVYQVPNG